MIVREEEVNIGKCLESVQNIVDEMIIVDTGSRDNTVSIVQSFGATVFYHAWQDDFSTARNISLDHAKGEWILILDADEVLAEESKTAVRALTLIKDVPGYLVQIQKYHNWTEITGLRLFKKSLGLRFKGIFNEILEVPDNIYSQLIPSDIKIIHKDWSEEDFKRKLSRNTNLLKKHINLYPDSIDQILDLVMIYLKIEKLSEAEALLQKVWLNLPLKKDGKRSYNRYLLLYYYYKLHLLYKKSADFESRSSICKEALSVRPQSPLFVYEAAKAYYKSGDYAKAIKHFEQCLTFGKRHDFNRSVMFPKAILGANSLAGLGYCFFKLHNYQIAAQYFNKSYSLKKDKKIQFMLNASRSLLKRQVS